MLTIDIFGKYINEYSENRNVYILDWGMTCKNIWLWFRFSVILNCNSFQTGIKLSEFNTCSQLY